MEKFYKEFDETLKQINYSKGINGFLQESIIVGAIFFISVLYIGLFVFASENLAMFSVPVFFLPLVLNYFYKIYLFEKRKRKIEETVPDLLLIASSLPGKIGFEKLVGFMAETSEGPLREEFEKAKTELKLGVSLENAFENIKKRNKSLALNRAIDLILSALNSGAEMNIVFRETAEDFIETNSILRERNANTTIEKYTLLLAGGIIVPLILGLLAGMISGFNFSAISELGIGMSESLRKEIVEAALLGNILYISEYALIASAFVAFQEGNQKKTVLYAALLVPIGLIVYFLGKGF
ncbi:MAG: type II secretion system F family protein [archaeon]|nr:type II secretion system F family protein [archaeon]